MASTIKVDISSAEAAIFSGEAQMVFASAIMGEIGIAPRHAPLITRLSPGEVRVRLLNGKEQSFYVSGGILEIQPDIVTILSDTATRAEDLDEAAVILAQEQAAKELQGKENSIDFSTALARNSELLAQLQVIRRLSKKTKS